MVSFQNVQGFGPAIQEVITLTFGFGEFTSSPDWGQNNTPIPETKVGPSPESSLSHPSQRGLVAIGQATWSLARVQAGTGHPVPVRHHGSERWS